MRELRSLFSMLRENSRRSSIHMPKKNRRPEKYIVDFYDAFRFESFMISCCDQPYMTIIVYVTTPAIKKMEWCR